MHYCDHAWPSSVVNFSHFRLLFWNRRTEFNETWQEAISQRPLLSLCFSGRTDNKMAALASDWLIFSTSPLKPLNEIQQNLTGSEISTSSTMFVLFGPNGKEDGHPGLWVAETFSIPPLKPLNWIQRNVTGIKMSIIVLLQVCVFRADRKNKMAALASDWHRHFWLLKLLNGIQRNVTGSKISTSSTKFVFFGRSEKHDGCPCLWLAQTFSTFPLKLKNKI